MLARPPSSPKTKRHVILTAKTKFNQNIGKLMKTHRHNFYYLFENTHTQKNKSKILNFKAKPLHLG